ncbi:MAG: DIP1984 family protein [Bulleidia sp.]|nr:DIP1984 family protein [Erysipelotrichaceae bacterium]MDY2780021.1 DIP1984 family protein [Bulleidia sp.]
MKLATALSERSDIQKRLSELQERLNNNAKVQDGETTAEDPKELLKELDSLTEQLETLIYKINLTNSKTMIDGTELTLLLAKRDVLKQKIVMLRNFLNTASAKVDRYSRTEIKILSSVDVTKLQKQIDVLSKEYRTIDEKIQGANWTTELL